MKNKFNRRLFYVFIFLFACGLAERCSAQSFSLPASTVKKFRDTAKARSITVDQDILGLMYANGMPVTPGSNSPRQDSITTEMNKIRVYLDTAKKLPYKKNSNIVVFSARVNTDGQVLITPPSGKNFYLTSYCLSVYCGTANNLEIQISDAGTAKITCMAPLVNTGVAKSFSVYCNTLPTPILFGTNVRFNYTLGTNADGSAEVNLVGYTDY